MFVMFEMRLSNGECLGVTGVQVSRSRCRIASPENREKCMNKFAIRLLTLAMFSLSLIAAPLLSTAYAAGGDNPAPPASGSTKDGKKKGDKSSAIDDPKFLAGYRTAYATIYDRNDYTAAIEQLKALGHDDRAAVANP